MPCCLNQRSAGSGGGRGSLLIGQDLDAGEPCGVVDGDMEEVVADALAGAAAVAGDAMADTLEAGELLDVEVDKASASLPAIASPVSRYSRRSCSIRAIAASASRLATVHGRDERFSSPTAPSRFQRASHFCAVRSLAPKPAATSPTGRFSSTIRLTISARPRGVRRAFLWMFIRSSEDLLKLRNSSVLARDRMDNLMKAHS